MSETFSGWPTSALAFFEGLEADNSKAYWEANRPVYERDVVGPMKALAEAVAEEFGPLRVFRPHRDTRFSADKTPYKTHCGALGEGEGGEHHYLHVGAQGLFVAGGMFHLAPDQLSRLREGIADDDAGPPLVAEIERLEGEGLTLHSDGALKTAPRGYPRDHPRIELLRRKGVGLGRQFEPAPWLATPAALERVVGVWRGCAGVDRWLADHVGPTTLPPDDLRPARRR